MKYTNAEIKKTAIAHLEDARSFLLATVASDGQLKFAQMAGTPAEEAACSMQARAMAAVFENIALTQILDDLKALK